MADSRLKRLMEKREAVNARIKQEQSKLSAGKRRADTHRKVLAGAAVLQWAARDNDFSAKLMTELKAFLVRDADRALFDIPPVLSKNQEKEPDRALGDLFVRARFSVRRRQIPRLAGENLRRRIDKKCLPGRPLPGGREYYVWAGNCNPDVLTAGELV